MLSEKFGTTLPFVSALRVAVDNVVIGREQAFAAVGRSGLSLHEAVAKEAQIVGLLDGAAVDGGPVHEARDLVDLLSRPERAADPRGGSRAHVLLALDVVAPVDRVAVRQTDRVALRVEFVQIHAATPEALTQKTWRHRRHAR